MSSKTLSISNFGSTNPKIQSVTLNRQFSTKKPIRQYKQKGIDRLKVASVLSALKKTKIYRAVFSYRMALVCLTFVTVGVFFSWIYQVNNNASFGYEIKAEQKALAHKQEENKKLLFKQAASGSITILEERASALGLVPITNQQYLSGSQLTQR